MRSATLAKLALTATVGIGALIGQANIASAGNGPMIIKAAPTTTTTVKPIKADPADYCDLHLCLEADPVDPQPDPPFDPDLPIAQPEDDHCPAITPSCDLAPAPQGDDDPDSPIDPDLPLDSPHPGCQTTHGCPPEDQPCSSEDQARTNCDGGGTTDGGTDDGGTDGQTTDGGTTGGGTDGHDGHLPHTGTDVASMALVGLGLTGVGAAAKRFSRKARQQ
jgi:LPXTG-motif cell wall-anchored protein